MEVFICDLYDVFMFKYEVRRIENCLRDVVLVIEIRKIVNGIKGFLFLMILKLYDFVKLILNRLYVWCIFRNR